MFVVCAGPIAGRTERPIDVCETERPIEVEVDQMLTPMCCLVVVEQEWKRKLRRSGHSNEQNPRHPVQFRVSRSPIFPRHLDLRKLSLPKTSEPPEPPEVFRILKFLGMGYFGYSTYSYFIKVI